MWRSACLGLVSVAAIGCASPDRLPRGPEGTPPQRRLVDDVRALAAGLRAEPRPPIGDVKHGTSETILLLHEPARVVASLRPDPDASCAAQVPRGRWIYFAGDPAIAIALMDPPRAFSWDKGRGCAVELHMPTFGKSPRVRRGASVALAYDHMDEALPKSAAATVGKIPVELRVVAAPQHDVFVELALLPAGEPPVVLRWSACEASETDAELATNGAGDEIHVFVRRTCRDGIESDHHGSAEETTERWAWRPGDAAWLPVAAASDVERSFWEEGIDQLDTIAETRRTWHNGFGAFEHTHADERFETRLGSCEEGDEACCSSVVVDSAGTDAWSFVARDGAHARLDLRTEGAFAYDPDDCAELVEDAVAAGRVLEHGSLFVHRERPRASAESLAGLDACSALEVRGLHGFRPAARAELAALRKTGVIGEGTYRAGPSRRPPRDFGLSDDATREESIALGTATADTTVVCVSP